MERTVNEYQAWEDFWQWVKTVPAWAKIQRTEKQSMYRASYDHARGGLGPVRIRTILERYGNGRYTFTTTVIIKE